MNKCLTKGSIYVYNTPEIASVIHLLFTKGTQSSLVLLRNQKGSENVVGIESGDGVGDEGC